jgi:DNA-binding GntR family transcriptional regulator
VEVESRGGSKTIDHYLGARALANRQYELAASYFGRYPQRRPRLSEPLHILALCKAGKTDEAQELAQRFTAAFGPGLNYTCW